MEPVTIFMLTNTVAALSNSLFTLIHNSRKNDEMLEGLEQDLSSLRIVTEQVQAALKVDEICKMIGQGDGSSVFIGVNDTFKSCRTFLDELSGLVEKSRSKRTNLIRLVNTKYRSNDRAGLQRRLVDSTRRVQIGLQIITLQATCRVPNYVQESASEIVGRIRSLENKLEDLRASMSPSNNVSPSSSTVSVSDISAPHGSMTSLENAARETISQAMVIWKDQKKPRSGSIHTVDSARSRNDPRLNQSGVVIPSGSVHRKAVRSSHAAGNSTRYSATRRDSDQPVIIAVCGMTGSGKSSFISTLADKNVGIGHGLKSKTDTVNQVRIPFEGRQITLVDTPGFADTTVSDTDVLKMIAEFMATSYEGGALLSGIIYLHQIHHNRVEGPSLRNINMFQKLCGEGGLKNVILATTMWDTATTDQEVKKFVDREEELMQTFWDRMIKRGSQVRRYYNTRETAKDLIRELVQREPIALDIQSELIDEHKDLADTTAGSYIDEELTKLHKKYQEELNEYFEIMETSTKEARREAMEEYEKVLHKMRVNEEETRILHQQRLSEIGKQRDDEARARVNDARAYDKKLENLQKSFTAEMKESAKQADRQTKSHEQEKKYLQDQQSRLRSDLLKQHEHDLTRLQKDSETKSSKEKAALAKQLEDQFTRQLYASDVSANEQMSRLTDQIRNLSSANAERESAIAGLNHNLRAAAAAAAQQDSNNNNNVNSGNSDSRSYHNHLGRTDSALNGSKAASGSAGSRAIPPPPPPPELLHVPGPTKHYLGRGMAEKAENDRRVRAHEKRLDDYYRRYK